MDNKNLTRAGLEALNARHGGGNRINIALVKVLKSLCCKYDNLSFTELRNQVVVKSLNTSDKFTVTKTHPFWSNDTRIKC